MNLTVWTGRINSGLQTLFTDSLLGNEFAGRRRDTGQRIMGFACSYNTRCFSTSINENENMIAPIPDHWSMVDTQTILITYCTVWYALIIKGYLKRSIFKKII